MAVPNLTVMSLALLMQKGCVGYHRGKCERGSISETLLETKVPNLLCDDGTLFHVLIPFPLLCLCIHLGYLAHVYARLSLNIYVKLMKWLRSLNMPMSE